MAVMTAILLMKKLADAVELIPVAAVHVEASIPTASSERMALNAKEAAKRVLADRPSHWRDRESVAEMMDLIGPLAVADDHVRYSAAAAADVAAHLSACSHTAPFLSSSSSTSSSSAALSPRPRHRPRHRRVAVAVAVAAAAVRLQAAGCAEAAAAGLGTSHRRAAKDDRFRRGCDQARGTNAHLIEEKQKRKDR